MCTLLAGGSSLLLVMGGFGGEGGGLACSRGWAIQGTKRMDRCRPFRHANKKT